MEYNSLPDGVKEQMSGLDTPFFLYDLDTIRANVKRMREAFSPDEIFYAVKCNSLPKIIETIAAAGAGFEANNINELEKIAAEGVSMQKVINSSPVSSGQDIKEMYKRGVRYFAFDSKSQLDNLSANAPGSEVYLRIYTTNEGAKFNLSNRLGAHIGKAPELLNYAKDVGLNPYGITFHVGSQCLSIDNWDNGITECAALFKQFPSLYTINIGGGIPVRYNGAAPSIDDISVLTTESLDKHFGRTNRPKIIVEPGRFIVGDAALTASSVLLVNEDESISKAFVDMSIFSGLIEILENGGGFNYPSQTDSSGELQRYIICGPTCAGNDILVKDVKLPRLHADHNDPSKSSRVFFSNTGAYTLDYFPGRGCGFNGVKLPSVYYMEDGKII